jgi:hypothetical protein
VKLEWIENTRRKRLVDPSACSDPHQTCIGIEANFDGEPGLVERSRRRVAGRLGGRAER